MGDEYLVTVLDVGDPVVMADRILAADGTWTFQHTQTTFVYQVREARIAELSDLPEGRARLVITDTGAQGTRTVNTTVDDLDTGLAVMDRLGCTVTHRRECARTTFTLDQVTVAVDRWPGIPPLLQLTADHPSDILSAARRLGFPISRTHPLTVAEVYARYGIDLAAHAEISFAGPPGKAVPGPTPVRCGTGLPDQVRVVLVTQDRKLLLIRRTRPGRPVYWQYPGGAKRPTGETLHDTARRTVHQQVGGGPTLAGVAAVIDAGGVKTAVFIATIADFSPAARTDPGTDDPDRATYQLDTVDLNAATLAMLDIWPAAVTDLLLTARYDALCLADAVLALPARLAPRPDQPGDR